MKRILPVLLIIIVTGVCCFGQTINDVPGDKFRYEVDQKRHLSILAGYNFWGNHYGELGLAVNQFGRVGYHPVAWAYFMSGEIKIDNTVLIGPKIGVWAGGGVGGMALGLNLIYYTDFDQSSFRIRPEIGMGFGPWKVVYGYNIPLTNKKFEGVNNSNVGIAVLFGIKKLKVKNDSCSNLNNTHNPVKCKEKACGKLF